MQKKGLFLISSENEIESVLKFSEKFKEKYNMEIDALYVKDVLKYEIFPMTIDGIGVNMGISTAYQEYKELEDKNFDIIKDKLNGKFSKIYSKDGETVEITLEELKKYDLLIVVKNEKVTPYLKEILRSNYKPLIILPNIEEFSLEKVLLLDDGAYNANKTLFTFFYLFDEQKIDILRINNDEKDDLVERFGENYNPILKSGDPFKIIMEEQEKYDFILMGDLRYTVMVEKITGKLGVKLLENIKKPIFIG